MTANPSFRYAKGGSVAYSPIRATSPNGSEIFGRGDIQLKRLAVHRPRLLFDLEHHIIRKPGDIQIHVFGIRSHALRAERRRQR